MTAQVVCVVAAFVLGMTLGAVAGVLILSLAKVATDPHFTDEGR